MNGRTRKKLYDFVAKRDGEFCVNCDATPKERQLILEHKDNNPKNNKPENLQLYCRPCNYLKNPRRPENQSERNYPVSDTTELGINRRYEPEFRKYVYHEVNEHTHVPEKELICSGAEKFNLSTLTTKRYLDKLCSAAGCLEREKHGKTIVVQYKKDRREEST